MSKLRPCVQNVVLLSSIIGLLAASFAATASGEAFIVEDGKPNAEILIAEKPPRTVRLAAWELRNHLREISGAELPIVHEPGDAAVKIYIGSSEHTDKLGVTNEGLEAGAYRIVSGDDWLCLIGTDTDFEPIEPYTRWRSEGKKKEFWEAWDAIAHSKWGAPTSTSFKMLLKNVDRDFLDEKLKEPMDLWSYDERGSYNAVCGFLRKLGVRWYWPGEAGTVVPKLASIPLPKIDERVEPVFALRDSNVRFGVHDRRLAIWAMRLGMRQPHGYSWAHGLNGVTSRKEMKQTHPEYYALLNGKRFTEGRAGKQCLSSPGLIDQTIRYARTLFDHYDYQAVSVQPADGYTSFCQCPLCAGKDSPERPQRGRMSDYVWGFTKQVADEVAKTHPDRKILNMAYNFAVLPPEKIDKLPDNVQVCLIGARGPARIDPEERRQIVERREAWKTKTNNKLVNFENYPHTARGHWLPSFTGHINGESVNDIKGDFLGEDIEPDSHRFMEAVAFNSYPFYFTFRMYWGDENQDVDAMLDEFYALFYGPAREPMKAFYEHCEANHLKMRDDKKTIDQAVAYFEEARKQVAPDSVYAKRLDILGDYLEGMVNRGEQIVKERERENSPELRMWRDAQSVKIDGDLSDPFWETVPYFARKRLVETQTGRDPAYPTYFKVAWGGNHLYFYIRCEEPDTKNLNIRGEKNDDPKILDGDCVEIFLETEQNSFYHIAVNPAGAIVDLNRKGGEETYRWDSQAEVATQIGDGFWAVEMKIPVTDDANDPFHLVLGRCPVKTLPWYMNICRRRPRANGTEITAFSPTSGEDTIVSERFAKFYK